MPALDRPRAAQRAGGVAAASRARYGGRHGRWNRPPDRTIRNHTRARHRRARSGLPGVGPVAARRQVAIKTPHPEVLLNIEMRERFLREGVAAARLTHPNIVSVLEVGRSGPLCYIVSAYSDGQSLATLLENAGSGLSPRLAARWVAELADAVEHAHRHGVLHRDLKPGNVVLDSVPLTAAEEFVGWQPQPAGQEEDESFADLVPMLTDFGLAKLMDIEDVRTRTGALLGTPAYLAPEQVDPELGTAGPRSDVYGLGAILYECLTGQRLFESANQASLLRHIAAGDVTPPRRVHAELPRDLEAICLRALARRPDDRYASAAEMAADLRRYLACEVTIARPLNIVGRSVKWARRRPTASATLSVAVLALVALAVGALWHFAQLKSALAAGQLARRSAEQSERNLRQLVYFRDMQEAYSAVEAQDVRKASAVLSRYQPGGSGHEPGFLWRHLRARCTGDARRSQRPRRACALGRILSRRSEPHHGRGRRSHRNLGRHDGKNPAPRCIPRRSSTWRGFSRRKHDRGGRK